MVTVPGSGEQKNVFDGFEEFTGSQLNNIKLHQTTQPFIIDIDGDMRTDLVYVEPQPAWMLQSAPTLINVCAC